jgi:hypothetical protein
MGMILWMCDREDSFLCAHENPAVYTACQLLIVYHTDSRQSNERSMKSMSNRKFLKEFGIKCYMKQGRNKRDGCVCTWTEGSSGI